MVDVKRFSVGAQAKYRCNAMLRLVGAEIRTCKSDGTWSGAVPYCAGGCDETFGIDKCRR